MAFGRIAACGDHELAIGPDTVRTSRTETREHAILRQHQCDAIAVFDCRLTAVVMCCTSCATRNVCAEIVADASGRGDTRARVRVQWRTPRESATFVLGTISDHPKLMSGARTSHFQSCGVLRRAGHTPQQLAPSCWMLTEASITSS